MNVRFAVVVGFLMVGAAALTGLAAPAASTARKGATAKAPAKAGAKSKSAAVVPAAKRRGPATAKRAVGRRTTKRRGSYSPYVGQQRPAPERIQEIERALADKGFLAAEADTNWDQASIDAMRRFQQSQNIAADGRLSSLSLVALGLGAQQNGVFEPLRAIDAPPRPVPAPPPAQPPIPSPSPAPVSPPAAIPPPPAPPAAAMPEPRPAPVAARPAAPPPLPVAIPPAAPVAPPPPPSPRPPAPAKNLPLVVPDTSVPQ